MMDGMANLFEGNLDEIFAKSSQKAEAVDTGSEKVQKEDLNTSQRALLRVMEDRGTEKIPCFGGVLIKRFDAEDNPVLSFVVEGMTESELTDMKRAYDSVYRSGLPRVISRAAQFVEQVGNYTAFNFVSMNGNISLREYCKTQQPSVETVLRKLLNILIERHNCGHEDSLHCFSLDTLFVGVDRSFWILPLRAFRNRFPRGIAPEALDPTQPYHETSDLFSAAYVALEVNNGGSLPEMLYLDNAKIKDCLLLIPQCRPSLKTMREVLGGRDSDDVEERVKPQRVADTKSEAARKFHIRDSLKINFGAFPMRMRGLLKSAFAKEPEDQVSGTCKQGLFKRTQPINQIDEGDEDSL